MPDDGPALTVFAALQPDAALTALVGDFKARTKAIAGDQLYLADPPHATVYLAQFADAATALTGWHEFAARFQPVDISLVGWHVFEADPLTGNQTLVCEIAADDKQTLRGVQAKVVEHLAPLRDAAASVRRFAPHWEALSAARQQCVEHSGFPFIGAYWEPHVTVASVRHDAWSDVWRALEPHAPRGTFRFVRLRLAQVVDGVPQAIDGLGELA